MPVYDEIERRQKKTRRWGKRRSASPTICPPVVKPSDLFEQFQSSSTFTKKKKNAIINIPVFIRNAGAYNNTSESRRST